MASASSTVAPAVAPAGVEGFSVQAAVPYVVWALAVLVGVCVACMVGFMLYAGRMRKRAYG